MGSFITYKLHKVLLLCWNQEGWDGWGV